MPEIQHTPNPNHQIIARLLLASGIALFTRACSADDMTEQGAMLGGDWPDTVLPCVATPSP